MIKKNIFTLVFLCINYSNVYGNDFEPNPKNSNFIKQEILNTKQDVNGNLKFLKKSYKFLTKYISYRLLIIDIKEKDKTYVKIFDQTYPSFFKCHNSLKVFYKNELEFYTNEYLKELPLLQLDNILTELSEKHSKSNEILFNCIDIYTKAKTNFDKTSIEQQVKERFK